MKQFAIERSRIVAQYLQQQQQQLAAAGGAAGATRTEARLKRGTLPRIQLDFRGSVGARPRGEPRSLGGALSHTS